MPGRNWISTVGGYRYSHNGHEKENEIFEGAQSAEFWMYDGRLGRRWERDPITYPWQSPYAAFNNNPIYFSDPRGLKGEGDGNKDKKSNNKSESSKVAFPSNPKDGQEYVHKDDNTNWGYVYDKDKGWIGTGASASLPPVTVTSSYDPKGMDKVGNDIAIFLNNCEPVFELSGDVDVGFAIGIDGKIWGQDAGFSASLLNAKVYSGKIDLNKNLYDKSAYSFNYIGKDDKVSFSQGVSVQFTQFLSADVSQNFDAYNLGSDYGGTVKNQNWDGNLTIGLPLLKRENESDALKRVVGNAMSVNSGNLNTNTVINPSTGGSFYGLDIGAGLQIILGAKVSLKIGLQGKK